MLRASDKEKNIVSFLYYIWSVIIFLKGKLKDKIYDINPKVTIKIPKIYIANKPTNEIKGIIKILNPKEVREEEKRGNKKHEQMENIAIWSI